MKMNNVLTLSTGTLVLLSVFNLSACSNSDQQDEKETNAGVQKNQPEFAEVIKIEEVVKKSETPKEVCKDVPVTQKVQPKDDKQIAGTVTGAAIGGVLGNQIGGGKGKTLATVSGRGCRRCYRQQGTGECTEQEDHHDDATQMRNRNGNQGRNRGL